MRESRVEPKERPVIVPGEVSIEPGLKLIVIELVPIDAGENGRADQNFPPGIVLAGAAVGEGTRSSFDALLPDFELLQFRFERADAVIEFGHGCLSVDLSSSLGGVGPPSLD